MQNSSNPNSAGLSRPPKRFLQKGLLTFATCMALADEVFAQSTTSPWTQAVQALQTAFTVRTIRTFQNFRPLVIHIDELGRALAVDYKSLEYHPGDREAKYFLAEFCRLYYRRNRYTIHDDFTKALYFLDGKVANDIMEQYRKDDTINAFLTNPSSPELDIDVEKVALQPMQAPPYRASVDYYRVEYAPADRSILKKTLYTANFIFLFKDDVPNELIPANPLGLTITYFREDQAFTNEVQR